MFGFRNVNAEPAEMFLRDGDPRRGKLLRSQVYSYFCLVSGSSARETTRFMLTPCRLCTFLYFCATYFYINQLESPWFFCLLFFHTAN